MHCTDYSDNRTLTCVTKTNRHKNDVNCDKGTDVNHNKTILKFKINLGTRTANTKLYRAAIGAVRRAFYPGNTAQSSTNSLVAHVLLSPADPYVNCKPV